MSGDPLAGSSDARPGSNRAVVVLTAPTLPRRQETMKIVRLDKGSTSDLDDRKLALSN
jgi:hypothetical protein